MRESHRTDVIMIYPSRRSLRSMRRSCENGKRKLGQLCQIVKVLTIRNQWAKHSWV